MIGQVGYNYNTAQKMPPWLNEGAGRLAGRPEGGAVMATTVLGIGSQHDFHRILSSFACIWDLGALGLTFYL